MHQYPDPPGSDGYFYLVQISGLADASSFYYPDRSLAFFVPALIKKVSGDSLFSFQLSIALFWFFIIILSAGLVYLLCNETSCPGDGPLFAAAALALSLAFCFNLVEFSLNYFKNLAAVALFLPVLVFCLRGGHYIKFSIPLFLTALLMHKLVIFLGVLLLFVVVLNNISEKNFSKKMMALCISTPVVMALIFIVAYERSVMYLAHLSGYLATPGQWMQWVSIKIKINPGFFVSLMVSLAGIILYLMKRKGVPLKARIMLDFMALVVAVPFVPFQDTGPMTPAYRLMLISPIFSFMLLYLMALSFATTKNGVLLLILIAAAASLINGYDLIAHRESFFPPWSEYNHIENIQDYVKPDDVVIAHHGLKFYITYRTGRATTEYLPDAVDEGTYRVAFIPEGRPAGRERELLKSRMIMEIGSDYGLFKEKDWQELSKRIILRPHWKNPENKKPPHIY